MCHSILNTRSVQNITMNRLLSITFLLVLLGALGAMGARGSPKKSKYMLSKPQCNAKRLAEVDLKMVKLLGLGEYGRAFPENLVELKPYCKETSNLVSQIEAFFKDCYRKDISDLANILVYSIRSQIKVFCGRKTRRLNSLLKGAGCINEKFLKNTICIDRFNNQTRTMALHNDDKIKIPHTCCAYVRSMECIDDFLVSEPCSAPYRELYMDLIRGIMGGFTNILCGDYNEETDKCEILGPLPKVRNAKKLIAIGDGKTSFITAVLTLLESLKNYDFSIN